MPQHHISPHILRIYDFVSAQKGWAATDEIAAYASVSGSTARHHALELTRAGLFDRIEVFPGYRYRIAAPQTPAAKEYLDRMNVARTALSAEVQPDG